MRRLKRLLTVCCAALVLAIAAGCGDDPCAELRQKLLELICTDSGAPPVYSEEITDTVEEMDRKGCPVPTSCEPDK